MTARGSPSGGGPLRIALIYAVAAGAWIWLTDLLLLSMVGGGGRAYWLSLTKGFAFVVITAGLLFLLIRHEFRLRESTYTRLRALVAASPVAIVTLRDDDVGFTSWNAAAEALFGWEDSDDPNAKHAAAGQLRRLLHEGRRGPDGSIDAELEGARGNRVLARVFVSRLGGDEGADWLVLIEDRTARIDLERQLTHAQKMEAIGRLAGGIAHDFNNLITVMLGNVDLALEQTPPDAPIRTELEEIRRTGERASRLTRQLLLVGRRSPEKPVPLDINEVVRSVLAMLERIIGEDVRLHVDLADHIPRVRADHGQLEQVLLNLAVNARDAMPGGGTLQIATARLADRMAAADLPPDAGPGEYVILAVTDTGQGMDAETQARAFEPFFTTKPEGKGTGLGLASVYGIVRSSGGHVTLRSKPGRGTSVRIYLPTSEAD